MFVFFVGRPCAANLDMFLFRFTMAHSIRKFYDNILLKSISISNFSRTFTVYFFLIQRAALKAGNGTYLLSGSCVVSKISSAVGMSACPIKPVSLTTFQYKNG